jgi:hypothetical protein
MLADMQVSRIMGITTGRLTVTDPRMVIIVAPDMAIGTAIGAAATTVTIIAAITMIIVIAVTDHQGARNRAVQHRPFLLKYCKITKIFEV